MSGMKLLRAAIAQAIRRLGGKTMDIVRVPTDPNGQPMGEAESVGRLYGAAYMDVYRGGSLKIDIPGIVTVGSNRPVVVGLLLCGEAPKPGDKLRFGDRETDVLSVAPSPGLYSMTVKELI